MSLLPMSFINTDVVHAQPLYALMLIAAYVIDALMPRPCLADDSYAS